MKTRTQVHSEPIGDGTCAVCCGGGPLPGVLAPMNEPSGVQRCDECAVYDGDLAAALALAKLVGGVVRFEAQGDGGNHLGVRVYEGGDLPGDVFIAPGTDPYVEVDGEVVDWEAYLANQDASSKHCTV